MDYFISDLHLGHEKIIEFERTDFKTIQEHDDYIISQLKKKIYSGEDTLYILGDIGWNWHRLEEINAKKILIRGNHDTMRKADLLKVFDEVHDYPIYYNRRILLSHYPHPVEPHVLNLHGHLHNSILKKSNQFINLSAHMCRYIPISANQASKMAMKLGQTKRGFMEEWYADDYVWIKMPPLKLND